MQVHSPLKTRKAALRVLIDVPCYTYRCEHCKEVFEINHGMFFEQERCIKCSTNGFLVKVPNFTIKKQTEKHTSNRVGAVVDEFIKDAKKDLKKQREDFKTETYDK